MRDLPVGPPPRVGYVVRQVHVAPDGARTRVQRGFEYGVQAAARLGDDAVLVEDADNFEGYSTVRLVRGGRPAGRWSTYGGIVVGRDGSVAFGEATTSEAERHGPVAVHFFVDGRHLRQPVEQHPIVHAIVGHRLVFEYRFPQLGDTGPFVTDLVSPPRRWTRAVPERAYDPPVHEPGGDLLEVVDLGRRSAIVRTRRDGSRELAAPFVRQGRDGHWTAYTLELPERR